MSAWPWLAFLASLVAAPGEPSLRLPACPDSPNCVSTQADPDDARHYLAPLRWPEGTSLDEVLDAFEAVLADEPRTRVVVRHGPRLEATATSRVFRFVDDVLLLADEASRTLHLRSAARLGYGDFGVNRRRAERLLQALALRLGMSYP